MTVIGVLAQFSCARGGALRRRGMLPGALLAMVLALGPGPALAQQTNEGPPPPEAPATEADTQAATAEGRGPVTNLPLPRFVSLKDSTVNARRGPSLSHRIDWEFKHAGMPMRLTAEFGHWRRVEDRDGAGGWVHYSLLSGVRTVIVEEDMTELHARADAKSAVVGLAEMGAIARLGDCTAEWCKISAEAASGWVEKARIWGVGRDEIRD